MKSKLFGFVLGFVTLLALAFATPAMAQDSDDYCDLYVGTVSGSVGNVEFERGAIFLDMGYYYTNGAGNDQNDHEFIFVGGSSAIHYFGVGNLVFASNKAVFGGDDTFDLVNMHSDESEDGTEVWVTEPATNVDASFENQFTTRNDTYYVYFNDDEEGQGLIYFIDGDEMTAIISLVGSNTDRVNKDYVAVFTGEFSQRYYGDSCVLDLEDWTVD